MGNAEGWRRLAILVLVPFVLLWLVRLIVEVGVLAAWAAQNWRALVVSALIGGVAFLAIRWVVRGFRNPEV